MRHIQTLLPDLEAQNVQVFSVTEDNPAKNPHFGEWIAEHDKSPLPLLPLMVTGAGSVIVCRHDKPIHLERTIWHLTIDEFKNRILNALTSDQSP